MSEATGSIDALPPSALRPLARHLGSGRVKLALLACVALVLGLVASGLLPGSLARGLSALGRAEPSLLWLAGAGFIGSLAASAGSWRSTLATCGAQVDRLDACARVTASVRS
jgi:uncharacterized membrane protein YbhN (UPF0104 family)